jgi:hypothetical protein
MSAVTASPGPTALGDTANDVWAADGVTLARRMTMHHVDLETLTA